MDPKKISEILLAVALMVIPSVFSMRVMVRIFGWLLSWGIILYFVFTNVGRLGRLTVPGKAMVCVGATILIVTFSFNTVFKMWKQEKAAALSGEISAPHRWFEKLPIPKRMLQVGDSGTSFIFGGLPNTDLFKFLYNAGLKIEVGKNGLEISTPIRGRSGNIVAEIKGNRWSVSPDPAACSDKNYNKNSLEVKDGRGQVVMQIVILRDRVQIQGEWHDEFGNGAKLIKNPDPNNGGALLSFWRNAEMEQQQAPLIIQPIFKYPSSEHWGELIETKTP